VTTRPPTTTPAPVSTTRTLPPVSSTAPPPTLVPVPPRFVPIDGDRAALYAAVRTDQVNGAFVFATEPDVADLGLVVLADDQGAQPAQNLIPVVRTGVLPDGAEDILAAVSALVDTPTLASWRAEVRRGTDVNALVMAWLRAHGLDQNKPRLIGSLTMATIDFDEPQIMAALYAAVLRQHGMTVTIAAQVGQRDEVAPTLEAGTIDFMVEYLGAYLAYFGQTPTSDRALALGRLSAIGDRRGFTVLRPTVANDTDAIALRPEVAARYRMSSVTDLRFVPDELTIAGPSQCPTRPQCLPAYEQDYQLMFTVPPEATTTTTLKPGSKRPAPTTTTTVPPNGG
jgi:glycine betaine/choline ABC-type transport system substrate-binding protein